MKTGSLNRKVSGLSIGRPAADALPLSPRSTKVHFMNLTKSALGAALVVALFPFITQAVPPPTGVAPVTVPAGGFGIGGELVAGTAGLASGDWLPGVNGAGVLDASGAPLNPNTTFHFVDAFNSSSDDVFSNWKRSEEHTSELQS